MIEQILRSLPVFRGKQRIARLLLNGEINSGNSFIVKGKGGCKYNIPNIQENVGFEIYINGIYEEDTIEFVCRRVKKGGYFLDIGANIGAISLPVGKKRSDIQVISLEAAPWIFEYLNQNVGDNNLYNVKAINKAIADVNGSMIDFYSPKDKFGKGSMAPVFTNEAVKVETITLDQLVNDLQNQVDLIKIDVEGFEALAFAGGSAFLASQQAPDIVFEFVDWAEELAGNKPGTAQLLLQQYGYTLFLFENGKVKSQLNTPIVKGGCMILATKIQPLNIT